jgi:DNA-binding response OmpR family regulator
MKEKYYIIAVDDDDAILDMYKNGLVDFDVLTFDNPKEAWEFLNKTDRLPDLILMDIMMSYLDGITFIREIRMNSKLSLIPVIAVSGLGDAATLNDALLFGATDYIIKPFDIGDLSNRIKRIIEKNRIRREER